jgi:hypothetical protein
MSIGPTLRDYQLRDACRIFFWERWLLTFKNENLSQNYASFYSLWKYSYYRLDTIPPKKIVDFCKSSGFIRILLGYTDEELLKNRENYYCGRPTFFSEKIEAKFGYSFHQAELDKTKIDD